MDFSDFLNELDDEVQNINASYFDIEISETYWVPSQDDANLTYENFDNYSKKVKTIETCVLFIDIRKSTAISLKNDAIKMTKLYSSFSRSMIKIAEKTGGKVRNIIGDRVMVVFDSIGCCEKAIESALLMNTVTKNIINKHFNDASVKCGIGIAFGEMLVSKCGSIKQGKENSHYKYLVWAGKTANIASKLTDAANKYVSNSKEIQGFRVGFKYPWDNDWTWKFYSNKEFEENVEITYPNHNMKFKNQYFMSFYTSSETKYDSYSLPPILITKSVYEKLKLENKDNIYLKNCSKITRNIENIGEEVYGLYKTL